jgi:F5/8 type C domain
MKYRLAFLVGCSILLALAVPACVMRVDLTSSDQAAPPNTASVTPLQPTSSESVPCVPSATLGSNIASGKRVTAHAGGVNYDTHNDAEEFNSTTRSGGGDWLNQTNSGDGSYQVIDLEQVYSLVGVGYYLQWDSNYANPLTMQVEVSNDLETWELATKIVHRHTKEDGMNWVNIDLSICPVSVRYIKFWLPPDGEWNGWGNFFQLRVYALN